MHNHEPDNYVCPLCQTARGLDQDGPWARAADVVFHDASVTAFVSPKWWPKNPGHVVVIPNVHYENIYDIPDEVLYQVQSVGKRVALAMKRAYDCDGTSFRQHNEPAGNQEVWHYHLHVFPRFAGDELYRQKGRSTTPEERQPYAEKLRAQLGH